MKTRVILGVLITAALWGTGGRLSANLISNPGFETGNFSGWTTTPAPSGSSFGVNSTNPHSGTFEAFFSGDPPFRDIISQNINTPTGTTYTLTFWLALNAVNIGNGGSNAFRVVWGSGMLLLNTFDTPTSFGYTQFTFTGLTPDPLGSPAGTTQLSFSGRNSGGAFFLDDVSVTQENVIGTPDAGNTAILLVIAAGGLILVRSIWPWPCAALGR